MPRNNYREAISQAIGYINTLSALDTLSESAIKQGVVLRVLSAAGWDTFDLSEVQPEYRTGNTKVDFGLMSPSSARARTNAKPLVLVEVKSAAENLESDRYERQMMAHCARNDVSLAVLTNGLKWLLYFWSAEGEQRESRFCEVDLNGDLDAAADDINRYLAKDRVSGGQAARSAERALVDRNRDEVTSPRNSGRLASGRARPRRRSGRTGGHRLGAEDGRQAGKPVCQAGPDGASL